MPLAQAEFTIAVFAIASERLLVVASALTAILLGWNLFTRAITLNQSGTVSVGEWKVELKAVGPGIFFSLFGTVILVYVLIHPAQYTASFAAGSSGPITFSALGVGSATDKVSRSYVRAINSIAKIELQVAAQPGESTATLLPAQRKDLASATTQLKQLRREILVSKLGAQPIDEWEKNEKTYSDSKQQLPTDLRERLDKIAPWFTETVIDDGAGR